jgi:CRISPR/Cas system CSM-associated protein Csm5 (group 7 of RAMP superfamily)
MGHRIEPFMLDDDSSNILSMLDEKLKQLNLIDDLRAEEEMGTEAFEKMKEYEKEISEINQFIEKQQQEEDELDKQELEYLLEQENRTPEEPDIEKFENIEDAYLPQKP